MHIRHIFKTATTSLKYNKLRSVLTILGIVIGVTAIILVVSLGKGAEGLILDQIQSYGSGIVEVAPGRKPEGLTDIMNISLDSLKERDLKALRNPNNVRGVDVVMPVVMRTMVISYEGDIFRPTVIGATPDFDKIFSIYPDRGMMFSESDVAGRRSVVVIGSEIEEEFFSRTEALGKKISIKGRPFRVIGVLKESGQMTFFNPDKMIVVPYTTAQKYLLGIDHFHAIEIKAESEKMVPMIAHDITLTLRELHGIDNPDKDDFYVSTQDEAMDMVGSITGILTALLVSIAAISLVVGGVGIMNIMLVSVAERTREIGLRKALGATKEDIRKQFLLESVILTGTGGIVGILVGLGLSILIFMILGQVLSMGWKFAFSIPAALIGVGVSMFIGLIFGIYPAKKAAEKSPIEALRYE